MTLAGAFLERLKDLEQSEVAEFGLAVADQASAFGWAEIR
jgi:hypothetical protein